MKVYPIRAARAFWRALWGRPFTSFAGKDDASVISNFEITDHVGSGLHITGGPARIEGNTFRHGGLVVGGER